MPVMYPQPFSSVTLAEGTVLVRTAFDFDVDEVGVWSIRCDIDWGAVTIGGGSAGKFSVERVLFVLPATDPPPTNYLDAHMTAGPLTVGRQQSAQSLAMGFSSIPDGRRTLSSTGEYTAWACLIARAVDSALLGASIAGHRPNGGLAAVGPSNPLFPPE